MEEEQRLLFAQLQKLVSAPPVPQISEKNLSQVLKTLWDTRKSGLDSSQKQRIQRLLSFSDNNNLQLVLPCLRFIIAKCVRDQLVQPQDIAKIFPNDDGYVVPAELRNMLVSLLHKFTPRWIQEASTDLPICQQARVATNHGKIDGTFDTLRRISSPLWERKETAAVKDDNSQMQVSLPQFKSMTWTMLNRNITPSKRVAVITLKLQDNSRSSPEEIEVKFQLTKDTLEVLLRSLTGISEQLSSFVGLPSEESSPKKQRQD